MIPLCVRGEIAGNVFWRHHGITNEFTLEGYDGKSPRHLFFQNEDGSLVGTHVIEGDPPANIEVTLATNPSRLPVALSKPKQVCLLPAMELAATRARSERLDCTVLDTAVTVTSKLTPRVVFEIAGLIAGAEYEMQPFDRENHVSGANDFKIDPYHCQPR